MGWGLRPKYRTSSYSSDFEFIVLCFKCVLVLLERHSSGEFRYSAAALIILYTWKKVKHHVSFYKGVF